MEVMGGRWVFLDSSANGESWGNHGPTCLHLPKPSEGAPLARHDCGPGIKDILEKLDL